MNLIGYLRLSKDENGNGLSLQAQRHAIQRYAKASEHEIVEWLEDVASGKNMERPGLQAALAMLEAGEAEGLIVAKLDRISRSLRDFANLLGTAQDQHWNLIAIDLGVDTSSIAGELVVNVMMSIAQWERRTIGQRTSAALQQKKRNGQRLGAPIKLPDKTRHTIRRMRDRGDSFGQIADHLNRRSIPTATPGGTWYPQKVRKVWRSLQLDEEMRALQPKRASRIVTENA